MTELAGRQGKTVERFGEQVRARVREFGTRGPHLHLALRHAPTLLVDDLFDYISRDRADGVELFANRTASVGWASGVGFGSGARTFAVVVVGGGGVTDLGRRGVLAVIVGARPS